MKSYIVAKIKNLLEMNGINYAILCYFVFVFSYFLSKPSGVIDIIASILISISYIYRIFVRFINLKNFSYIDTDYLYLETDATERASQILDVFAIVLLSTFVYIRIFCLAPNIEVFLNQHGLIGIIIFSTFVFLLSVYFSLSKTSYLLKALSILFTTIQGVVIVLFSIVIFLTFILSFFTNDVQWTEIFKFKSVDLLMLMISFDISIRHVIIIGLISILCQIIFFILTPAYQLGSLEIAYKVLNVFFAIVAMIALVGSGLVYNYAIEDKGDLINEINNAYVENEITDNEFMILERNIETVSKSTLTSIVAILFMPYTIGALFISLLLSLRKRYCDRKAKKYIRRLIIALDNNDSNTIHKELVKKILYFSNDEHIVVLQMLGL